MKITIDFENGQPPVTKDNVFGYGVWTKEDIKKLIKEACGIELYEFAIDKFQEYCKNGFEDFMDEDKLISLFDDFFDERPRPGDKLEITKELVEKIPLMSVENQEQYKYHGDVYGYLYNDKFDSYICKWEEIRDNDLWIIVVFTNVKIVPYADSESVYTGYDPEDGEDETIYFPDFKPGYNATFYLKNKDGQVVPKEQSDIPEDQLKELLKFAEEDCRHFVCDPARNDWNVELRRQKWTSTKF